MKRTWMAIGRTVQRRSRAVAALAVVITVLAGLGLTRLRFETSQASLISTSSEVYRTSTSGTCRHNGRITCCLVVWPSMPLRSATCSSGSRWADAPSAPASRAPALVPTSRRGRVPSSARAGSSTSSAPTW